MSVYDDYLRHCAELAASMKQPPFPRGCTWFHPAASQEDFWQQMKESHRAPVVDEVKS